MAVVEEAKRAGRVKHIGITSHQVDVAKEAVKSDLFETGISKQFQDIFWFHLAQEMADQGGLGIWKMVYQQMNRSAQGAKVVGALENEK